MSPPLRLRDVVMMNVVAVTSLRWIATAAAHGPASLTLWAVAILVFFTPLGLAVASLSTRYPGEGGLYRWTQRAFGDRNAFLCGWCYWVNNLLYLPAMLLYVCANIAFSLNSVNPGWHLEHHGFFVAALTLGVLWGVALLSILGLWAGRWLQDLGGLGNWILAFALGVLGVYCVVLGQSQVHFQWRFLVPDTGSFSEWSFFAQLCFSLSGLELVSFVAGEIPNARQTIRRSVGVSGLLILGVYFVGTWGVLSAVPQAGLTAMNAIIVPFQEMGNAWGLPWLAGVAALILAVAGIASVLAWFSGSARIPYIAGVDRFLPPQLAERHPRYQTPVNAILLQAVVGTLFTVFAIAGDSTEIQTAYQVLVDMCLVIYFIPYCYLFLSLGKLTDSLQERALALVGLSTTLIAVATTLLVQGAHQDGLASIKVLGGTAALLALGGLLFYWGSSGAGRLTAHEH